MRKVNWILFTSFRYLKAKRDNKLLGPSTLAVAGISIGVMALISVLGVMNGFQLGFIEDIININSFHIRVYSDQRDVNKETMNTLLEIEGVESVLPFMDIQTLIKGRFSDFEAVNIRAVPGNIRNYDSNMAEQLNLVDGDLEIKGSDSIILGNQLASRLGVGVNDYINLVSMEGTSFKTLTPSDKQFEVTGLFQSGYYNFDRSMGFTILANSKSLASGKESITYGIKLFDKYNDPDVVIKIQNELETDYVIQSWRDFNTSFFTALRTEKTAMMLVIGLIFLVVGVNIKHSLERSVVEKREEIGVLMSLGSTSGEIKGVFIIEGFIIGLLGGFLGLFFGLLITTNINSVFRGVDQIMQSAGILLQVIISPLINENIKLVSMYSSENFYITEVPVRIIYSEIVLIFIFAVISSTWASFAASKAITKYKPSEVLRYE
jgi:lipoprotein-releasing system permease protein